MQWLSSSPPCKWAGFLSMFAARGYRMALQPVIERSFPAGSRFARGLIHPIPDPGKGTVALGDGMLWRLKLSLSTPAGVEAGAAVDRAVAARDEGHHCALAAVGAHRRVAARRPIAAAVTPATPAAIPRRLGAVERARVEQVGVSLGAPLGPAARASHRRRHALLRTESLLGGGVEERVATVGAGAFLGAVLIVCGGCVGDDATPRSCSRRR